MTTTTNKFKKEKVASLMLKKMNNSLGETFIVTIDGAKLEGTKFKDGHMYYINLKVLFDKTLGDYILEFVDGGQTERVPYIRDDGKITAGMWKKNKEIKLGNGNMKNIFSVDGTLLGSVVSKKDAEYIVNIYKNTKKEKETSPDYTLYMNEFGNEFNTNDKYSSDVSNDDFFFSKEEKEEEEKASDILF